MRELSVGRYEKSLSDYLTGMFPLLTAGMLNKFLRENKIKVNGKKVPLYTALSEGDTVSLYISDDLLRIPTKEDAYTFARADIDIIYEDDNILVVNKPSGIPVIDDDWKVFDTLMNRIRLHYDGTGISPRLCHRLDTGTSGLVICSKSDVFHERMLEMFRTGELEKDYICLVRGRPERKGTYSAYLTKNSRRGYVTVTEDRRTPLAKPIQTRIDSFMSKGGVSLVKIGLITGRTHQIRAHMAFLGMPILGDSRYGDNSLNRKFSLKYQCLCCRKIVLGLFDDPQLEYLSDMSFTAPDPWFVAEFDKGRFDLKN